MIIPTIDWRTRNLMESDFISHELHPTGMEQFMACPYKFQVQSHPEKFPEYQNLFGTSETARDAFYEGDITEQLMTAYQYGEKLGDEVLRNFGNSTEFAYFSRLKKHAENWKQYLTSSEKAISDRFPLFTQKRMSLRILMDGDRKPHEFYLTGTADWIYSDYTIADCKTSKAKRGKNEADFRLQRRLYPRMRRVTSNLPQLKKREDFDFTYYVFTKQVTPQLQVINLNYKYEDSERLIFHLLTEYKTSYDNDEREPKKCLGCKWCPLRTQCPRYAEDGMASFTANHTDEDSKDIPEEGERRF